MRSGYQYSKLSIWDLKYRLEYHNKTWYDREDAIYTLMQMEQQKETEYSKYKCLYCMNITSSCICKNRRYIK